MFFCWHLSLLTATVCILWVSLCHKTTTPASLRGGWHAWPRPVENRKRVRRNRKCCAPPLNTVWPEWLKVDVHMYSIKPFRNPMCKPQLPYLLTWVTQCLKSILSFWRQNTRGTVYLVSLSQVQRTKAVNCLGLVSQVYQSPVESVC